MSPTLKKVEKTGIKAIKAKRTPYKIKPEDFFKDTETNKSLFSKLINSQNPESIVTIPSVSYAMANIANNLHRKSGTILVSEGQFPSNVYPWLRLQDHGYKVKIVEKGSKSAKNWNEDILKAIDKDTVLLALGHVHWADGTKFYLSEMRKKLDRHDGLLIVDGTQSIGALPFNQQEIQADAVVCAGYKWLMGPYGIGMAYFGERFHSGIPIEENWINRLNSHEFSSLVNYQDEYRAGAQRFGVGEQSNFILVPMLREAMKQVLNWTPKRIQEYTRDLFQPEIENIQELGYTVENEEDRASHLFGIQTPKDVSIERIQKIFKEKKISVSFRGDSIRISPHVYNDNLDVRKLLNALKEARD